MGLPFSLQGPLPGLSSGLSSRQTWGLRRLAVWWGLRGVKGRQAPGSPPSMQGLSEQGGNHTSFQWAAALTEVMHQAEWPCLLCILFWAHLGCLFVSRTGE